MTRSTATQAHDALNIVTKCAMELTTGIDYRTAEPLDPLDMVGAAGVLAQCADDVLHHVVERARTTGCTWAEIGDELGTTRQAAQQRFGR